MGFALATNGEKLIGSRIDETAWNTLKSSYRVGDFVMPCCNASAIPKTSPNGHHFFAHRGGGCATAPESIWHLNAKALIEQSLRELEIECTPERGDADGKWTADIFFTYGGRQIAVELQRSPQTLERYRIRQRRYEVCNVECYWLLYAPRYNTLMRSMAKWRIVNEFGGKIPKFLFFACVADVPTALLDTEVDPVVRGPGLHITIGEWLRSVLDGQFQWHNGAWLVKA